MERRYYFGYDVHHCWRTLLHLHLGVDGLDRHFLGPLIILIFFPLLIGLARKAVFVQDFLTNTSLVELGRPCERESLYLIYERTSLSHGTNEFKFLILRVHPRSE